MTEGSSGRRYEPIVLAGNVVAPSPNRAAIFLDRDGTLNELVPDPDSGHTESPLTVGDVRLIPGAATAADRLAAAGYALVCISNQPSAAKGKTTVEELEAVHQRVLGLLAQQGVEIELSLLCPHHPEGSIASLSGACECRKPAPGMLLRTAVAHGLDLSTSWMIGDTDADVEAGRAAGCRTVLLDHGPSSHKRLSGSRPDVRARDLMDAATQVLGRVAA